MKTTLMILLALFTLPSFGQKGEWVETKAEILEVNFRGMQGGRGGWFITTLTVKFNLEDGTEQIGSLRIFDISFSESSKSVGENITINYQRDNPALVKSPFEKFLMQYGLYIFIAIGVIYSVYRVLKLKSQ